MVKKYEIDVESDDDLQTKMFQQAEIRKNSAVPSPSPCPATTPTG